MLSSTTVESAIFKQIALIINDKSLAVTSEMQLIGSDSVLDSMQLVELCLALEDMAADLGFEFDWTSEAAMSKSRSMFRTAGALAAEFLSQMESKK